MMKYTILTALLMAVLVPVLATAPAGAQQRAGMSIAAVVNEDAISEIDVNNRLRLILASSGLPDTPDMRARALGQVLDSLIDEQIRMQEAARNGLTVSEEEIQNGFAGIAANNKMTAEQFEEVMKHQGISRDTLNRQIKAQIAWTKVVSNVIRPRVSVSQNDVAALQERMEANLGKTEYLVSEIFLPVDNEANDSDVRQLGVRLASEITGGKAAFAAVAAQVSRAGSAERGGDIGWVQEGRFADELDAAVKTMEEGAVSQPIRSTNGYYIIQLRQKRIFAKENIPSREDMMNQIGFERLERAQQRYLSDLKAAAFVERRI